MKSKLTLAVMILLVAALACGRIESYPAPSPPVTVVTPPITLFAPVTFENVSFSVPLGMGSGATAIRSDDVELPFINPSNGPMPQHIVFSISGYLLPRGATIMVFKASEYSAYSELTEKIVTALQDHSYQGGQAVPEDLDIGPFYAQATSVLFQNGQGLRYMTEILTGVAPISNDALFYYYQGLTNDGAFFVSAHLPISIGFLAADGSPNSAIPINGIPFPGYVNPDASAEDIDAYYSAIKDRMDVESPENFTPSLAELDKMIQSIQVNPQ